MITTNVIHRIFKLKYKDNVGTCFTMDLGDKQYFVTAKHILQTRDANNLLVDELQNKESIEIFHNNRWFEFETTLIGHHNEADVSVFSLPQKIDGYDLPATMEGLSFGQEIYFLGFPYGITGATEKMNRGFPFPLVKKGIVSAMHFDQPGKPFLIDGHNNSGFSGGPVVFCKHGATEFRIAGVISGYQPEYKPENGKLVPIENTNSGIIIAYSIKNATDLVELFEKAS